MHKKNSLPVLYIKPNCPWCREALTYFHSQGIELDVRDVLSNVQDMDTMLQISGQALTPTFEYQDFVVADFSVDEFQAEINEFPEIKKSLGIGH